MTTISSSTDLPATETPQEAAATAANTSPLTISASVPQHCGYRVHCTPSTGQASAQWGGVSSQPEGAAGFLKHFHLVPEVKQAPSHTPSPVLVGAVEAAALQDLNQKLEQHCTR